ncbi:MAG: DUF4384 domain-containing protein [Desulfobulbaceae bacterium]|nr:DUF4384 domain-containing protein [Desulfobulbaceae bacterium]
MKNSPYLAILLTLLTWITPGFVAAATTVTVSGEAYLANITPEEAQSLAVKRARNNAIGQVCGVRIQSETLVENLVLQSDFIHQVTYGRVVKEEIVKWDVELDQKSPTTPPALTYQVTMIVDVQEEKGEPDPFYKVNVKLNKSVYESNEEMIINVSATKEGYLTILNFSADGTVTLLFPNKLRKNNKIKAQQDYQIPSPQDREHLMKFQVATLPGHKKDTEYIKVISTRGPIDLLSEIKSTGNYGIMNSAKFAVTEVARLMAAIPIKDRAENTAVYQIVNPRLQ